MSQNSCWTLSVCVCVRARVVDSQLDSWYCPPHHRHLLVGMINTKLLIIRGKKFINHLSLNQSVCVCVCVCLCVCVRVCVDDELIDNIY